MSSSVPGRRERGLYVSDQCDEVEEIKGSCGYGYRKAETRLIVMGDSVGLPATLQKYWLSHAAIASLRLFSEKRSLYVNN